MTEEEEVGVYLPGLTRPLYGAVTKREAGQVTVSVYHGDDRATITVDEDLVRPWRERKSA
jgi:hypothetical protein